MRRLLVSWLTFLLLAAAPFSLGNAQDSLPVRVGDRVRVTAPAFDIDKYDGTLRASADDTLIVDSLRMALASVTRLDVYQGRTGNMGKGALIGTLIGVPTGLAFGVFYQQACSNSSDIGQTCLGIVPLGAVALGVTGALIGGTIGALIKHDRWEEVPLDQLGVSFLPQRDGRFAFSLSVRF